MRIDYDYGAPDMGESIPHTLTPDKSNRFRRADVEEDVLPLYQQMKSIPTGMQTYIPFIWATPTKSAPRVESYQGANTPATITSSLEYDSSENSVSTTPWNTSDEHYADEVRLSIDFQNLQVLSHQSTQLPLGKGKTEVILQTFGPKFVLEVMGGAGAVWGFSEAIGLRTSMTVWFWRPVTMFAAALFFIRWCWQLQAFVILYDRQAKRRPPAEVESAALLSQENNPQVRAAQRLNTAIDLEIHRRIQEGTMGLDQLPTENIASARTA